MDAKVRLRTQPVATTRHVSAGVISTRVKHIVRVLVDGARTHERIFLVNKWQGQTTESERVKAEAYCVEVMHELASDPQCKSFVVNENRSETPLGLTEAQMQKLEELE